MPTIQLRNMTPSDRAALAELICVSTNHWYRVHGRPAIFADSDAANIFFDVYERLDPGCGLVAEDSASRQLVGSCFYHPRPTHMALGIMNVHPNHYARGVARKLLQRILEIADQQNKPTRLISSALNLDSFSLYTRAGFVPRQVYQDMVLTVPDEGLPYRVPNMQHIRDAALTDVSALGDLEMDVAGIRRDQDYRHFIRNQEGFWNLSVYPDEKGNILGFLGSCAHRGANSIGPGIARTPQVALALLLHQLDRHHGRTPVFLVPADCPEMVQQLYQWGAKNVELHCSQVRGAYQPFNGIVMGAFMPESA
jgi:GNAT superfamily N-acetyltransferase